jgi:hypothetical protein
LNGGDGFSHEPLVVVLEFVVPEASKDRIFDLPNNPSPVKGISQKPGHPEERHILAFEKGSDRCVQNVLQSWSPGVMPDVFEGLHNPGGNEVTLARWGRCKEIETNGVLRIAGVEIYDVVGAPAGDVVEDIEGEIAVGIDESDTSSSLQVLSNEIAEQSGFPSAGFSNDVDVLAPVACRNSNRDLLSPDFSMSND